MIKYCIMYLKMKILCCDLYIIDTYTKRFKKIVKYLIYI